MRATLGLISGAVVLIAFTALTGNSDAIDPGTIQDTAALPIPLRDSIGQTLIARTPRLSAIEVLWSIPANYSPPPDQRLTLHLRASSTSERDLATASLLLDQIHNNEFSKFTFAPIPDSENQSYYFFFDPPTNSLALWSSGEDAYADGALYANGVPTPRDLAFRAYYTPDLGMLARSLAQTFARFPIPIFLFILLTLAFAVSPAFQRTHASPRHLHYNARTIAPEASRRGSAVHVRRTEWECGASVAFLILLAIATALLQIRDLPAPLWVDSLVHAQYVQFILTHVRLPTEYFYHLGFHVLTALTSKFLNLSVPQSLLLTGQFSWVLVGFTVFFLSRKISQPAEAAPTPPSFVGALVAAVCVWFLSPTPAYFITWGRYPLVLGSALLALALLGAIKLFEQRNARNLLLAALSFAILAFTQIRLVAFFVAFVFVCWFISLRRKAASLPISNLQNPTTGLQAPTSNLILLSISFLLLPVLWLIYLFSGGVTPQSILAQNQTAPSIDLQTAFKVIVTHHGVEFLILAALSAMLGLTRRSRVAFLMLGWIAALGAIALILRAPILGELVPLSLVVLMAFLPASILIGDAAQVAYERLQAPNRVVHAAVWVALIGCLSVLGARDMVNIANPATILFTRADEQAMNWISANVPRDRSATFLVNSFNWVGTTFVPSDGGGWIPFFTGNPVEYLDATAAKDDSDAARQQWITAHQIQYVYLGTRPGTLSAAEFIAQPEIFSLVCEREGIRIFKVR